MRFSQRITRILWFSFFITWEQCKFESLAETRRGLTYNPSNISPHGIRVLRSSNINEDTFVLSDDDVFVCPDAVKIECVKPNDILITAANGSTRLVGKHAIIVGIRENEAVHGGFMLVASSSMPFFLNAAMSAPWYLKFINLFVAGGNGAIGNLNKNDLDNQLLFVPKNAEQEQIGEFFRNFDNLITLHQRKQNWQNLRFLRKISSLILAIAWEQRKLGEYIEVSNDKNTENVYGKQDVLSVSGDFGVVNQIEFQGRSFAGVSVSNYGILHTGEVVYTKSPLNANPYGIIKTNKGKTGIVSVLYGVYRSKSEVCIELIQTYFEMDARLNNYLRPLVNKGAKNTLLISDEHALEGEIIFPACYQEQCMIYGLFNKLDNLITLHQRKYEKFVNIKKALLEKMFPQGDEKVPRIRFKGFTDAWEQRKLGEISEKTVEKNRERRYSETFTNSAEFGIVSQMEYFDHAISKIESIGGYYVVHPDDFVYNPRISVSAPVGPINRNKLQKIGIMSPLYTVFRAHDIHPQYLEYYFKSDVWHAYMRFNGDSGARSDRFSIKTALFFDMPIPCPSVGEQEKIGKMLARVDNLITLHQRQVEKLKNIKSALLEKMFV